MRHLFLILALVLPLGCVPYSDTPLSAPYAEPVDPAIIGTWYWVEDEETGYLHVGIDEHSKLLRVAMVDLDRAGNLDISEFTGHTSAVDGNHYLNLKWVRPEPDAIPGYMVMKYQVHGDTLGIGLMDRDPVEQAIADGALKGEIIKGDWISSLHITEGEAKLRAFVAHNDKALFPEIKDVARLRPPPVPEKPKE